MSSDEGFHDVAHTGILLVGNSSTTHKLELMLSSSVFNTFNFMTLRDIVMTSPNPIADFGLVLVDYDYFKHMIYEVSNHLSTLTTLSQIFIITQEEIGSDVLAELKNYGSIQGIITLPISIEALELKLIEILGRYKILKTISQEVNQVPKEKSKEKFEWDEMLLGVIISVDSVVKFCQIKEDITEKSETLIGLYFTGIASKLSEGISTGNDLIRIDIGSIDLIIADEGDVQYIFVVRSLTSKEYKIVYQLIVDIKREIQQTVDPKFFSNYIIMDEELMMLEDIVQKHSLKRDKRALHGLDVTCVLHQPASKINDILQRSSTINDILEVESLEQIQNLSKMSFPKVICYNVNVQNLNEILNTANLISRTNPIVKQILYLEEYSPEILVYLMNVGSIDFIILSDFKESDVLNVFEFAISKSVTNSIGAYSSMTASDLEDQLLNSLVLKTKIPVTEGVPPELVAVKIFDERDILVEKEWREQPLLDFSKVRNLLNSLQDMDEEVLNETDKIVGFELSDYYFLLTERFGFEFLYTFKNTDSVDLNYLNYDISESSLILTDQLVQNLTYGQPTQNDVIENILDDIIVKINTKTYSANSITGNRFSVSGNDIPY